MKRLFFLLAASVVLSSFTACSHQLNLVNSKDGMTIHGTYHVASDRIQVQLPSGDLLEGQAVSLQDNIPPAYRDDATPSDVGVSRVYAVLTDNKGIMMEAVFHYNQFSGHGFGTAKTNKGDEYKIIF